MLNWYLVILLVIGIVVGIGGLDDFLAKVSTCVRRQRSQSCQKVAELLSFTPAIAGVLFLLPFIVLLIQQDYYTAAALTLSCSLSLGLAFLGKYIFRRMRPFGHTTYLGKVDSAFPSAHAAGSFAAAISIAIFWPPWTPVVLTLAALVAYSRIYLELHYFSDVMGGILLAYLMTNFVLDSNLLVFLGF